MFSTAFRPIREESCNKGAVPPSPTRAEGSCQYSSWNVTGRGGGKADYRKRTLEYVDSNRREYGGQGKTCNVSFQGKTSFTFF